MTYHTLVCHTSVFFVNLCRAGLGQPSWVFDNVFKKKEVNSCHVLNLEALRLKYSLRRARL